MSSPLTIGITECGKWDKYTSWVRRGDPSLEIIKLSWKENSLDALDRCHGVVLTGGEDVHPRFYGAAERANELDPKQVNEWRDEFELKLIERALRKESPVLGICRGLQIANVHFGGTLVLDLLSTGKPGHSKSQGYDRTHPVRLTAGSLLEKSIGIDHGEVNSAHHQAADRIGQGLRLSATSDDGVIEALEWMELDQKPFLLLVQWHPERMQNLESPFSKNLLAEFTKAAAEKQRPQQLSHNHIHKSTGSQ
jgi:putative glutamine amidotransferase